MKPSYCCHNFLIFRLFHAAIFLTLSSRPRSYNVICIEHIHKPSNNCCNLQYVTEKINI